jgi:hypothetical protein
MKNKKSRMFCVRVDDDLTSRFKNACKKANKKASELVREYMELIALKYGL